MRHRVLRRTATRAGARTDSLSASRSIARQRSARLWWWCGCQCHASGVAPLRCPASTGSIRLCAIAGRCALLLPGDRRRTACVYATNGDVRLLAGLNHHDKSCSLRWTESGSMASHERQLVIRSDAHVFAIEAGHSMPPWS